MKFSKSNGRAHSSKEIEPAYRFARSIGFAQINIDLIAGMVGETNENWRECVRKTIELDPDSVTIYQMEIPYNTTDLQGNEGTGANGRAGSEVARPSANGYAMRSRSWRMRAIPCAALTPR